jgi:hypothetical protein
MACSKAVFDALMQVAEAADSLVGDALGVEECFNPSSFLVGVAELNALTEALAELEQAEAMEGNDG